MLSLMRPVGVVIVIAGVYYFEPILNTVFAPVALEYAVTDLRPEKASDHLNNVPSRMPASTDSSIRPAPSTEPTFEEPDAFGVQLLDEQVKREAAAYEESLLASSGPRTNVDLTEWEQHQIEHQDWLDEQAKWELAAYEESLRAVNLSHTNADLTEWEQHQIEQQGRRDEQARREAAAYEESLRATRTQRADAESKGRSN